MKQGFWMLFGLAVFGALLALFKTINLFSNINFKITSVDPPQMRSGNIVFPVNVLFSNPTGQSLTIDDILNDIYVYRNGWVMLGTSKPRIEPIVIQPRTSTPAKIFPTVSSAILLREFGANIITSLFTLDFTELLKENFKIDSRIIISGRELARDEKIIGNPQLVSGW